MLKRISTAKKCTILQLSNTDHRNGIEARTGSYSKKANLRYGSDYICNNMVLYIMMYFRGKMSCHGNRKYLVINTSYSLKE